MTDNIYITEMTEQHVEQCTDLLVRSFMTLNNIWKKYNHVYQDIYPVIRSKVLPALHSGWSFVMIKNDKVVGVELVVDMVDYLKAPSVPSNLELFVKLGKAGKELESQLDLSSLKRGENLYGPYAVIDPKEAGMGYSLKFWWQCFAYAKAAGVKAYYSRISSEVSLQMLLKLGAQILAETIVDGDENQKFWMIKLDLTKPFPTFGMLQAMTKRRSTPRPSL